MNAPFRGMSKIRNQISEPQTTVIACYSPRICQDAFNGKGVISVPKMQSKHGCDFSGSCTSCMLCKVFLPRKKMLGIL